MRSNPMELMQALAKQRRYFIGGFGSRKDRKVAEAKYNRGHNWPIGYALNGGNGERAICRRLRQEIRAIAKRTIEAFDGQPSSTLWEQLSGDPENYAKFRSANSQTLLAIREHMLSRAG